jgi:hypothetical protein
MQAMQLPSQCGFVVDPGSLPHDWAGLEVWCSFDREAQFRLPQQAQITLPFRAGSTSGGALQAEATLPLQRAVDLAWLLNMSLEELARHIGALPTGNAVTKRAAIIEFQRAKAAYKPKKDR